ncbi:MAG TPA: thiamine phosphate synthase [Actinomycetota bacterium]|nr:thiamine phosphate synthase [Actinomycetota bacterium]
MAKLGTRALDLYVVTTGTLVPNRAHGEIAAAALEGGASAVQLRAPELADDRLLPLATSLAATCADAGATFIVNDRVDVAIGSGAAGVHLGQEDELSGARTDLGPDRILGVSVSSVEQARSAERAGADYLGVTVWSTPTKPEAVPMGLDGLRDVAAATALPVVGIGGIDAGNAREVLAAGASGVAVIGAVAAAPDPAEAVRELRAVVDGFPEDGR